MSRDTIRSVIAAGTLLAILAVVGCGNNEKRAAKPKPPRDALSFIPAGSFAAVVVHPRRITKSDLARQLLQIGPLKARLQRARVKPEDLERVILAVGLPNDKADNHCVIVETARLIPQDTLLKTAFDGKEYEEFSIDGKTCYRLKHAEAEGDKTAVYLPTKQTVVTTNEAILRGLLAKPGDSTFIRRLRQSDLDHDLVAVVECKQDRNRLLTALNRGGQPRGRRALPALLGINRHARAVTATVDLSRFIALTIVMEATDARNLSDLKSAVEYLATYLNGLRPPVAPAARRIYDHLVAGILIVQSGERVTMSARTDGANTFIGKMKVVRLAQSGEKIVRRMCWSEGGKHLYLLYSNGVLLKLSVPEFKEVGRLELNASASSLGRSKSGLAVMLKSTGEVVVVDEASFKVRTRIAVPGASSIATSPAIDAGFVRVKRGVAIVDLKSGRVRDRVDSRTFSSDETRVRRPSKRAALPGFDLLEVTPDGRYLFSCDRSYLNRFSIRGFALRWTEQGYRIGQGLGGIEVSPDSKLVCRVCGAGNLSVPNHPRLNTHGTYIYNVTNLQVPKLAIATGAYPRAVGFDPVSGKFYAQNYDKHLLVLNATGAIEARYVLWGTPGRHMETLELLVHPEGNKLLVRTDRNLFWCDDP